MSRWKDLGPGSSIPYLTLPREEAGEWLSTCQSRTVPGSFSNTDKLERSAHPVWSQHLKRLSSAPQSLSGSRACCLTCPIRHAKKSNAQNSWGMEQGAGSAWPHPSPSILSGPKLALQTRWVQPLSATAAPLVGWCRSKVPCTPEGS